MNKKYMITIFAMIVVVFITSISLINPNTLNNNLYSNNNLNSINLIENNPFKNEIKITNAEHLDKNKQFIKNIYGYVSTIDDLTYTIPKGEYVRAYFEENLTNKNIIDIFTRNSFPASLEIYEKDSDIVVGSIDALKENLYHIYLNHSGKQDVFDFKSVKGDIIYDYIHDADIETAMLSDDFEGDLSLWDDNGAASFTLSTAQALSPTHSAEGASSSTLISDNLNMADATAINVTFYYYIIAIDANDNVNLDYWDGAQYVLIDEIGDDAEGSWLTFSQVTTDNAYFDIDFHIRFDGSSIDVNEYLYIDDVTIIKTAPEPDTNYPQFSNLVNDTPNNTEYVENKKWGFNVTITSTNGTAGLEFNGINYTASNISASIFNVTISDLGAGDFSYYWWARGNGTSKLFNRTLAQSYTIAQNSSYVLGLTASTPIEYPTETDFTGSGCPSQLSCSLNISNAVYGVGTISANYSTAGNTNYSSNSAVFTVTIEQNTSLVLTQTYTSSITYGTATDFVGVGCPSQLTCSLNLTNGVFGAGTIYSNYSTAGNQNYTATSNISSIVINKAVPQSNLTNTTSLSVTCGTAINVSWEEENGGDGDVAYEIYRDGINVTSEKGLNITLGVGTYNYILNSTGGQNYSANASLDNYTITVNIATGTINGTINGTQGNFSTLNGTANQNIYINASVLSPCTGTGNITVNGTLYNSGTLPIFNITNLSIGFYNITFDYDGNTNCTSDSEVWWVNITLISDNEYPIFSNYWDNNGSVVNSGTGLFNVTVTSTNGTVLLEINNTNYTASNLTADVYNASVDFDLNGTYTYRWHSWGNGTNENYNVSEDRKYTVNYSDVDYPIFSSPTEIPSDPATYLSGQAYEFNITITSTNSTAGLEFNGTNYTATNLTDVFNITLSDLSAGNYSYYWWSFGNGSEKNYNISITYSYNISKAIPEGTLTNNTQLNYNYGELLFNYSYSEANTGDADVTYKVYRNGIDATSETDEKINLSAGIYDYILNATEGQNYSANASMGNFTLTIDQIASIVNLTLNNTQGNATINQGDTIDLNCTLISGDSGAYITLYKQGTLINNGTSPIGNTTTFNTGQIENITCIYHETANFTQSSETWWVNVSSTDSDYPLFSNPTETPTDSPTYSSGTVYEFNITIESTNGTAWISLNNNNYTAVNLTTDVYNYTIVDLPAGTYYYNWSAYGNGSNTNFNISETYSYTINQENSAINLTLNNTQTNITLAQGNSINLNCSIITGDSGAYITLYRQGTLINNGTSPIGNTTTFNTLQVENITCIYSDSQNYTTSSETWWVNVTDNISPGITIEYPANVSYTTNISELNYTYSDSNPGSCWYSNSSGIWNSSIVSAGVNFTDVISIEGSNTLTLYCNDTSNNVNATSVTFFKETGSNVSMCRILSDANTEYTLNDNIIDNELTGDCIIINAQNITLDCLGYYISSNTNYSGVYSDQYNTTIKNCNISMGSDGNSNAVGIEMLNNADYSSVINNTINGEMGYGIQWGASPNTGPDYSLMQDNYVNVSAVYSNGTEVATNGIYLYYSANNNITNNLAVTLEGASFVNAYGKDNYNYFINNTAIGYKSEGFYFIGGGSIFTSNTATSDSGSAIYFRSTSNNILTNNIGTSNSSAGIAVIVVAVNNNTLINNTGTSNTNYGLHLAGIQNNTLINNTGTSNSSYGVYLNGAHGNVLNNTRAEGSYGIVIRNSNNTIIQDCVNISGVNGDVLYSTIPSSNITFINCSYRTTGNNETVIAGGDLIRKWYYRAYVNDTAGNSVIGANVSAYNVSGVMEFGSLMTKTPEELESTDSIWTGLVGYWRLNNDSAYGENDTHVYDFSGNGNNGTAYGDIADSDSGVTSSGKINNARMFDGNGDYVQVAHNNSLNSNINFSISAWFNADNFNTATYNVIVSKGNWNTNNSYALSQLYSNLRCAIGQKSNQGASYAVSNLNLGQWYHAVCMANLSGSYLYIDSSLVASSSTIPRTINDTQTLRIGILSESSAADFNGSIDEVMIFNRSLSSTEIQELYEMGKGGFTNITTITDYVNLGGTRNYYSFYSINATNNTHAGNLSGYNVTLNQNDLDEVITMNVTDNEGPSITLLSPSNGVSSTTSAYNFTFNVSDFSNVDNCSLIVDNTVINMIYNVSKEVEVGMYNSSFSAASHTWSVNCTDSVNNIENSSQWSFTVTTAAEEEAGGGGGGIITTIKKEDLLVSPRVIEIPIKINSVKTRKFSVSNIGDKDDLEVNIQVIGLEEIIEIAGEDKSFTLDSGESRDILFRVFSPENTGIFTGKILVNDLEVLVSVSVNSEEILFDVSIIIPENLKVINLGGKLLTHVTLIPMGDEPRLDVALRYTIKDFNGITHLTESETLLVDGQKNFKKEFSTNTLGIGDYLVGLEVIYPNGVATSSSNFEIKAKELFLPADRTILIIFGVGVLVLITGIVLILKIKKLKRKRYKK